MESKSGESDSDDIENVSFLLHSGIINRARILPSPESSRGGVIQPVNPHYSGYDVVIDVENEHPDVQWLPPPDFVAVVIANEDATPLSQDEIVAIHVAPEFIASSDDERPASSYSILDRRHYRVEPPPLVDLSGTPPLAIGVSLAIDEELQDFNVWETLTTATATVPSPQDTPNRHSLRQGQEEAESSIPARKRKRKGSKRKRATEDTPQRPARRMTMMRIRISGVQQWKECPGADIQDFEIGHETFNSVI